MSGSRNTGARAEVAGCSQAYLSTAFNLKQKEQLRGAMSLDLNEALTDGRITALVLKYRRETSSHAKERKVKELKPLFEEALQEPCEFPGRGEPQCTCSAFLPRGQIYL